MQVRLGPAKDSRIRGRRRVSVRAPFRRPVRLKELCNACGGAAPAQLAARCAVHVY